MKFSPRFILFQESESFVSSDPFNESDGSKAPPPPYESVVMNDGVGSILHMMMSPEHQGD